MSQDSSQSRSVPRSIAASLIVVYYSGVGVVPKGNIRQIKASSSIIAIHVDAVFAFSCIQTDETMCRILIRKKS